jgi:hypothetical protein
MHGFIGFRKWFATPRSATARTTQAWLESVAEANGDEARFGEQLRRLHQSLEEANERATLDSRWGNRRHLRARAVGSSIARAV